MGGKALKGEHTITRRYLRDEFHTISIELIDILKKTFVRVDMPKFYSGKESFGDADILVLKNETLNMREYIQATFNPIEIFHNGSCWSFDYKELQVDLIVAEPEWYLTNLHYYGMNDMGNHIGRFAHRFGLKYGSEGLWYEHYFKGQNIGTIYVSQDQRKIYEFLGLSYDRYLQGFSTLEDIFSFVAESPYFNWKMFQLESLNKINRDRNAKRSSYISFLKWIDENVRNEEHECPIAEDKSIYLKSIMEHFPEAEIEKNIRRMEYEECKKLYARSKFNGGILIEKYGILPKDLGRIIEGFKPWVIDEHYETFEEFVIKTPEDLIYKYFQNYLSKLYENK